VTVVAEVGGRRSGGGRFGDGGAAAQARGNAAAGTEALAAVLDEHAGGAVALARADQLHVRTACLHLELGLVAAAAAAARDATVEAGGHDRHAHVVGHVRVEHGADDDGRVLAGEVLD